MPDDQEAGAVGKLKQIMVRCTAEEHQVIKDAAWKCRKSLQAFCLSTLLKASDRSTDADNQ